MKNIILVLISLYFVSCIKNSYTYTPRTYNNNQAIIQVNGVQVKKKQSLLGYSIQAASLISGAFIGYKVSPLITNYTSDGVANKSSVGGAAIGGLIGFGINNSFNFLGGKGKSFNLIKNSTDYNKWFNHLNRGRDYHPPYSLENTWIYVDRNKESQFQINNFEDIQLFRHTFPQSQYSKKVFNEAVNVCGRNALKELSKLYPNEDQAALFKKHLLLSSNFDEIKESVYLFPLNKIPAEPLLARLVKNYYEITIFLDLYPESGLKGEILDTIIKSEANFNLFSRSEIKKITQLFRIKDETIGNKITDRIISLAQSLNESNEDLRLYPNKKIAIEQKAIDFVTNSQTFDEYKTKFSDSKYIHEFEDGVFEINQGIFIGKNWDNSIKKPHGKGVFKSKDEIYIGSYNNGTKNGYGIVDANLQNIGYEIHYEGQLVNGKFNGTGKFTDNTPDCKISYEGGFTNNTFNGYGNASGQLGECYSWFGKGFATYTGNWKEGKFNGNGKYTIGEMWYEGGFEKGAMNGQGMLRMPNGIRVEGPWKDQNPNGRMHIFKFTLGGLIREDDYKEAYSIKDLSSVESNFIDKWNSSRSSSKESASSNIDINKFKSFKEDTKLEFKDAIERSSSLLSIIPGNSYDGKCPCARYKLRVGSYAFGKTYDIYKDSEDKWYFFELFKDDGPFQSYDELLKFLYFKNK